MTKQIKSIILLTATLAFAACSDDVSHGDKFTVGDADNAINLSIGVQSSPSALQSRAPLANHYAMQENTAINLYVEGDWTGKTPENIVKKSTYTAQADGDSDNINAIEWKSGEHLYWDDFGTADPDNTANRTKGLGILAVAIDGIQNTTFVNLGQAIDWTTFKVAWDLSKNIGNFEVGSKKYLRQDILVANNLYDASVTTPQKRYTFDEQKEADAAEARLDFKHVLSKITFNVTAGNGFNGTFLYEPNITLTRNKTGETNPESEWCYKNGTIDIKTATATHNGTLGTVELNSISKSGSTYTESAVIYPNSDFGSDTDIIARISADFNIYYVTAAQIRDAIDALVAGNTSHEHYNKYETLPGYHYIFNVTLNKTDIVVTATITDWNTVTANPVEPKIVVSAEVGNEDDKTKKLTDFRFYRNEGVNVPLGMGDAPTAPTTKNVKYTALADAKNPVADDKADGETAWKFWTIAATPTETSIYWPSHTTHYFFRGVYPKETTVADGESSYIVVNNAQYNASTFPSNLMIGAPEITDGTKCNNPDHATVDMSKYGICARTGSINLNFKYMMSQVEVVLKTTTGDDKVELNDLTKLELTNTICSRNIYLGTRAIGNEPGITRQPSYTMNMKGTATAEQVTFHDAIVPQQLKFNSAGDSDNMRFKVTITNTNGTPETTDDTYDVYYADIKPMQVGGSVIFNWVSGTHYKYELTLKKTGLSVTATITDWTTVTGSDDIWF